MEPIQRALGCFVDGKVTADTYSPGTGGMLTLNRGEPADLRGRAGLSLSLTMRYVIVESETAGPWKVQTVGYMYDLAMAGSSEFEYHWHPLSPSHETGPHLHARAMGKGHIPTGRILIEDVLNLATEKGAIARGDWGSLYRENRNNFALGASWGTGPGSTRES